jgi:hypothetical protein
MVSVRRAPHNKESLVAKKTKKATAVRRLYTKEDMKDLRAHSKAKTPVARIAKLMRRSEATLRQKALAMGLPLGHRR